MFMIHWLTALTNAGLDFSSGLAVIRSTNAPFSNLLRGMLRSERICPISLSARAITALRPDAVGDGVSPYCDVSAISCLTFSMFAFAVLKRRLMVSAVPTDDGVSSEKSSSTFNRSS